MPREITRRGFLKSAAVAAAATTFAAPRIVTALGANDKVNVAVIGCGGRGGAHVGYASRENVVALVDIYEPTLARVSKRIPAAKTFTDYRKMFDAMEKKIDAVSIATPDHNHACAAMMAIKRGKHVYCEKPLTWSVAEARALTEAAREHKVTTQMGNQGHCATGSRVLVEWVRAGAIGEIVETHSWTDRPWWPQGVEKRLPSKSVPAGLNWDEWIGPAPFREYHDGLHTFNWRGWCDFGNGALGDMACHAMDCSFWANNLGYPTSVELVGASKICTETYPKWTHVVWEFPERKKPADCKIAMPAMKVHWWDGSKGPNAGTRRVDLKHQNRPPIVAELEKKHGRNLGANGTVFIGKKGIIAVGVYGDGVSILDTDRHNEFKKIAPKNVLPAPRSGVSFKDFYESIRAGVPGYSNFDYAGPFTETILMGNLSIRAGLGVKVLWDGKNMKVTNKPELNRHISREYRKGWTL